jgi:hypothetical protein
MYLQKIVISKISFRSLTKRAGSGFKSGSSVVRIRGSGSVPKCHGSGTLLLVNYFILTSFSPASHQSDSSLKLITSDSHRISTEGEPGGAQYLLIEVQRRYF